MSCNYQKQNIIEKDDCLGNRLFRGAGDRTWTDTMLPPRDFKSLASAYSATPATIYRIIITLCQKVVKQKYNYLRRNIETKKILLFIQIKWVAQHSSAEQQTPLFRLSKPASDEIQGRKAPLMIYDALRAAIIYQACGLDKQKQNICW